MLIEPNFWALYTVSDRVFAFGRLLIYFSVFLSNSFFFGNFSLKWVTLFGQFFPSFSSFFNILFLSVIDRSTVGLFDSRSCFIQYSLTHDINSSSFPFFSVRIFFFFSLFPFCASFISSPQPSLYFSSPFCLTFFSRQKVGLFHSRSCFV